MFERMLEKYQVRFEGMPEPVFYKYFYPIGHNYNDGLWDLFWRTRGLKRGAEHAEEKFAKYHDDYLRDLRELLNTVWIDTGGPEKRHGVAVVPSSEANVTNRVTELVKELVSSNPKAYVDLTCIVVRAQDKERAHAGGKRSIASNANTLAVIDSNLVKSLDVIVVIDDVLTTGSSFCAINQVLRAAGFKGELINFAFFYTRPSDSVEYYLTYDPALVFDEIPQLKALRNPQVNKPNISRPGWHVTLDDGTQKIFTGNATVKQKAGYRRIQLESGVSKVVYDPSIVLGFKPDIEITFSNEEDVRDNLKNIVYVPPVEGIIFDLDQTLLDDAVREEQYENCGGNGMWSPYQTYDGVRELINLGIPFAIVSNRPEYQLANLLDSKNIKLDIFPIGQDDSCSNKEQDATSLVSCEGPVDPRKVFSKSNTLPENVFSYAIVEFGEYKEKLYKPCPDSVLRALEYLKDNYENLNDGARIVGIGNTQEDIIAYNAAGIESILALWGIPVFLRDHAIRRWGADYAFDSVWGFIAWCEGGGLQDRRLS